MLWDKLRYQLWLGSQLHIHLASAGVVTAAVHCSHTAKKGSVTITDCLLLLTETSEQKLKKTVHTTQTPIVYSILTGTLTIHIHTHACTLYVRLDNIPVVVCTDNATQQMYKLRHTT